MKNLTAGEGPPDGLLREGWISRMQRWLPFLHASPHPGKCVPTEWSSSGQVWKQLANYYHEAKRGFKTKLVFRSCINSGLFSCLPETVLKQYINPKILYWELFHQLPTMLLKFRLRIKLFHSSDSNICFNLGHYSCIAWTFHAF